MPSFRIARVPVAKALVLVAIAGLGACQSAPAADPASTSDEEPDRLRAVSFEFVSLDDAFWAPRLRTNLDVTIPHIMRKNIETGRIANLEKGAGLAKGAYEGRRFNDTDVYKIIEAASYALAQQADEELEAEVDAIIAIIAAAQEPDGYLFPARTIDPENPAPGVGTERWIHVSAGSHELYNAGHLIEAAVAHNRATGKRNLLDVAIRFADLIVADFGPQARHDIPGHEEIELALVKLSDLTGDNRYLDLAQFFIDERGAEHGGTLYAENTDFAIYNDRHYKQDHAPVIEQTAAEGHAVRATYLYTGMADVAARTDAPGYDAALESIWTDVVSTKMYLTGGIGSRGTFESFGDDYELPSRSAYTETCAAIGHDLWNHRMFLATGEARFLDVMERILYNGFLSGVSIAGDAFFYTNPLESNGRAQRSEYFDVACCPANLARTLALLPGFIYAQAEDSLFVNLYVGSETAVTLGGTTVAVHQSTDYPWNGRVVLSIEAEHDAEFEVALRVPGWAGNTPVPSDLYRYRRTTEEAPTVRVNGEEIATQPSAGFVKLRRMWQSGDEIELVLSMPVRIVEPHPGIEDTRGKVAIQRGPLVYAVEAVDNDGAVLDLTIDPDGTFTTGHDDDLLGGVTVLRGAADRNGVATTLTAVPYFAWANRGPGEMAVWIAAQMR